MFRFITAAGFTASLLVSSAAFSADYPDTMRGAYPTDWSNADTENPISIEAGLRYWYSMGNHKMNVSGNNYSANDTTHVLEGHLRIDDASTQTYLKANAGLSIASYGDYETPGSGGSQSILGGGFNYAGGDFGYTPFGNETFKFGGFLGYQFTNNSIDMGRENFVTASGGGNSLTNSMDFHDIRVGLVSKSNISDLIDLNVEVAAIPYSNLSGTYGAFDQANFTYNGVNYEQGSAGNIDGGLYGAAAEVMVGIHPTENLTLRVGGRASYLQGQATVNYEVSEVGTPANRANFIHTFNDISFLRYGLLAELTGNF